MHTAAIFCLESHQFWWESNVSKQKTAATLSIATKLPSNLKPQTSNLKPHT
jgi:hypothetical protein